MNINMKEKQYKRSYRKDKDIYGKNTSREQQKGTDRQKKHIKDKVPNP